MAVVTPDHSRESTPIGIHSWEFATSITPYLIGGAIGLVTSFLATAVYEFFRRPSLEIVAGEHTPPADQWRFLHVTVRNRPQPPWLPSIAARLPAALCRAWVTINVGAGQEVRFTGRWTSQREPGEYLPGGGLKTDLGHILVVPREGIPAGESVQLAVAMKYAGETACYGFNNENYLAPGLREASREIGQGRFRVEVEVLSGAISVVEKFELRNEGPALDDFTLTKI